MNNYELQNGSLVPRESFGKAFGAVATVVALIIAAAFVL